MMRLIQKILSHGLLIALVVAAVFVYIRRDELSLPWMGTKEKAAQYQTTTEKPGKVSHGLATRKPEDTSQKAPVASTPAPVLPAPVVEPAITRPAIRMVDKIQAMPVEKKFVKQPANPATTADSTISTDLPDKVQQAQPATIDREKEYTPDHEVESPANTEAGQTPAASLVQEQSVPRTPVVQADTKAEQLLQEARQLYWQRNIQAAEVAYRELGEAYPENPDVWGEIGDFYFNLRLRKPAGYAYSRCIELLIRQGKHERAQQILGILYRLDAPRARELEIQLQQASG